MEQNKKVLLVNGSPRKENWNTMTLLKYAAEGAGTVGCETEIVNLYDYTFKGCVSCFACKVKDSKTNGLCAYKDELTPVLQKAKEADVVILGAPVYYDYPTAQMRAFMERFMFPVDPYMIDMNTGKRVRLVEKTVPTAIIYTMNCPEWFMAEVNYPTILEANEKALARLFGYCETLYCCDTFQYTDYSKYDCNMFDSEKKSKQREIQFPIDCENAFELGKRLAERALEE